MATEYRHSIDAFLDDAVHIYVTQTYQEAKDTFLLKLQTRSDTKTLVRNERKRKCTEISCNHAHIYQHHAPACQLSSKSINSFPCVN